MAYVGVNPRDFDQEIVDALLEQGVINRGHPIRRLAKLLKNQEPSEADQDSFTLRTEIRHPLIPSIILAMLQFVLPYVGSVYTCGCRCCRRKGPKHDDRGDLYFPSPVKCYESLQNGESPPAFPEYGLMSWQYEKKAPLGNHRWYKHLGSEAGSKALALVPVVDVFVSRFIPIRPHGVRPLVSESPIEMPKLPKLKNGGDVWSPYSLVLAMFAFFPFFLAFGSLFLAFKVLQLLVAGVILPVLSIYTLVWTLPLIVTLLILQFFLARNQAQLVVIMEKVTLSQNRIAQLVFQVGTEVPVSKRLGLCNALWHQLQQANPNMQLDTYLHANPVWGLFEKDIPREEVVEAWRRVS